jgi:hypothetical protein
LVPTLPVFVQHDLKPALNPRIVVILAKVRMLSAIGSVRPMDAFLDFVANLTKTEIIVFAFVVVLGALLLPLSSGARSALVLVLIALSVFTLIGGGMDYVASLFR